MILGFLSMVFDCSSLSICAVTRMETLPSESPNKRSRFTATSLAFHGYIVVQEREKAYWRGVGTRIKVLRVFAVEGVLTAMSFGVK